MGKASTPEQKQRARDRAAKWYRDNYDRAANKRAAQREDLRIKNRKYYAANREVEIQRSIEYQSANREAVSERNRSYKRNNRERYSLHEHTRRARINGAAGTHTFEQWIGRLAFHGHRCRYCSTPLTVRSATRDHMIPLIKGGTNWPSNLVPACFSCNSRKQARTFTQYMKLK